MLELIIVVDGRHYFEHKSERLGGKSVFVDFQALVDVVAMHGDVVER